MNTSTIQPGAGDGISYLLPLAIITIWTALTIVDAIAQTHNSSRYDSSFRAQTIEDTEWRLPLSEDFGWDPAPTAGQGRPGVTAEFNDPILDHSVQPHDSPVSRSTGMSLRFKF